MSGDKGKSRSLTPVRKRRDRVRDDTHQKKQKDDGRRQHVRAESQQTAIAILHHELPFVPWHVAKSPSEFYALGGVLGMQCVGIFNEEVGVEQFVRVFVRIGGGRLGATEMNHLLVARHDGVDRRILPRPQACEAKLACVIGERCGNVHGEEYGRDLTEHGESLPQMAELPCGDCASLISSGGVSRADSILLYVVDSSATSWQYPGARFLPG